MIRVLSMKRYFLWFLVLIVLTACNQGDAGSSTQAASSSIASSKTQEKNLAKLPNSPDSFSTAKRILYEEIYKGHNITFYCGCDYDPKTKKPDWKSCGYKPRKNPVLKPITLCPHISLVILDNVGVNLKKFAPKKT